MKTEADNLLIKAASSPALPAASLFDHPTVVELAHELYDTDDPV